MKKTDESKQSTQCDHVSRHLRFGWWSLLVFLVVGITLEAMHGFKVRWYLDVANETRRLMFTLAHVHGTLLALVNILVAITWKLFPKSGGKRRGTVSMCMLLGATLMPTGFLLGGCFIFKGDPGIGILFVPVGAISLCVGVLLTAVTLDHRKDHGDSTRP